jgi:transposase-like protein
LKIVTTGGLSSSSIAALKKSWKADLEAWRKRPILDDFVYIWADGVNVKVRLGEDKKRCLLVLVGVNDKGEKKLLAVEGGYRESAENWKVVFNDLIRRGLKPPLAIIGDGALGLWAGLEKIPEFTETKELRCWVHKISNILNHFPKRLQPVVKRKLHDMMHAERKSDAAIVKKEFTEDFGEKYPKAIASLEESWVELTAFFDFPALHWQYLRTTNPIESTFATVKLRTRTTKGAGNQEVAETMAFKLLLEAEKRWRKLQGYKQIPGLLRGDLYRSRTREASLDLIHNFQAYLLQNHFKPRFIKIAITATIIPLLNSANKAKTTSYQSPLKNVFLGSPFLLQSFFRKICIILLNSSLPIFS